MGGDISRARGSRLRRARRVRAERALGWLLQDDRWVLVYVAGIAAMLGTFSFLHHGGVAVGVGHLCLWASAATALGVVAPIMLFAGASLAGKRTDGASRDAGLPAHSGFPHFLVIIPAYDEVKVISNSVQSLFAQDYPRDRYTVVVAFNGTDGTGALAAALGARVIETPRPGVGKVAAIQYVLDRVPAQAARYICVFDADNVVAADFLWRMAGHLTRSGARAVQGHHRVLIAKDNWISRGLGAAYAASSRLYNPGRSRLLRSALLCGTGFCIAEPVFRALWPRLRTQTEDIELNALLELHYGAGVEWAAEASFYDEKPDRLRIALRQRVRWMVGHLRTCRLYTPTLIRRFLATGSWRALELAFYYTVPLVLFASALWLYVLIPGSAFQVFHLAGTSRAASFAWSAAVGVYTLGLPFAGRLLESEDVAGRTLLIAARDSVYAMLFALIVWPLAIVLAVLLAARTDWIFHTPHHARPQALDHAGQSERIANE